MANVFPSNSSEQNRSQTWALLIPLQSRQQLDVREERQKDEFRKWAGVNTARSRHDHVGVLETELDDLLSNPGAGRLDPGDVWTNVGNGPSGGQVRWKVKQEVG